MRVRKILGMITMRTMRKSASLVTFSELLPRTLLKGLLRLGEFHLTDMPLKCDH